MIHRLVLGIVLVVGACGDDDGGGGGDADAGTLTGLASIRVEPPNQTLVIDGDVAATQTYSAIGTFDDGSERDITDQVAFSLAEPALGGFSGAGFTSGTSRGGRTRVLATNGSITGFTELTLVLRRVVSDPGSPGLPPDPGSLFDGPADSSFDPDALYPNDGVLVPPNLGQLEFHFLPAAGTVFELTFSNTFTDVTIYLECTNPTNGGCIYMPDLQVWRWLAESNRGTEPLAWILRGTDNAGSGVGTSNGMELAFSFDNIDGGIYYWTTSVGTAIMRFDFASTTQTVAEQFITTALTNDNCLGCHALSRDGTKMVTATNGSTGANVLLLDVGTTTPLVPYDSTPPSAFSSWSPDGSRYVGVYGGTGTQDYDLQLFDGNTGAYLSSIDVSGTDSAPTNHPDWSPDGNRIAYMKVGNRGGTSLAQNVFDGAIEMVTDTGMWSTPEVIVPAATGVNHYYPTFSPDGGFIAYNQSTCSGAPDSACDAYEDPSARLWMVPAQASATSVELEAANSGGRADGTTTDLKSSFPKWSPFVFQRTAEMATRLEWITFSSTRAYGLRTPASGQTWIWMAGVDPDAVTTGGDPSSPAFALPFQDFATSNHTAQWTTQVVIVE